MYKYPYPNFDLFSKLITETPLSHTMGDSLLKYLEIKIHPLIKYGDYNLVKVCPFFDRSFGISDNEKNGKLFNYMRPTAHLEDGCIYINCFPGIDYIFHYGNIIKSYLALIGQEKEILHDIPSEDLCWDSLLLSGIKEVPKTNTIIMGYVEGLQALSNDCNWQGSRNFLWKNVNLSSGNGILLGCKHTYWGDIAGRIVDYFARKGVERIIYFGKLGTLNPKLEPNTILATGNTSILPNQEIITWNNLFDKKKDGSLISGIHITVPSVLQETKMWLENNRKHADFVDPEIGHMALAAKENGIDFSYCHIISDNLSKKYTADLSNERIREVIAKRKKLCDEVSARILEL